jgi:hypothetical protein
MLAPASAYLAQPAPSATAMTRTSGEGMATL